MAIFTSGRPGKKNINDLESGDFFYESFFRNISLLCDFDYISISVLILTFVTVTVCTLYPTVDLFTWSLTTDYRLPTHTCPIHSAKPIICLEELSSLKETGESPERLNGFVFNR